MSTATDRLRVAIPWPTSITALASAGSALLLVQATMAQPAPGQWELRVALRGAPSGEQILVHQACLRAEQLGPRAEQTLVDEASRAMVEAKRPALSCTLGEMQRTDEPARASSWRAQCKGPRGVVDATGRARWQADAAELTQVMDLKLPLGSLQLTQQINARRTGACS